jgi:hypothetical protein
MFGVGAQNGGAESVVQCPSNTLVTGVSGGAFGGSWARPPYSFLQSLQFYCSGECPLLLAATLGSCCCAAARGRQVASRPQVCRNGRQPPR